MLEFIAFVVVAYFVIMWGLLLFVLAMQCFADWADKKFNGGKKTTHERRKKQNANGRTK